MQVLKPFFEGISIGHELNLGRIEEGVQRKGGRRIVPALIQTLSVQQALESVERVFESLGKKQPAFYTPLKYSLLALPGAVTFAAHLVKNPKLLRLHDSLGTVAIVSTAVSSAALIVLGNAALGGATLFMLGVGAMSRARLLPYTVRSALDKNAFMIAGISALFQDCALKKGLAIIEIALNLRNTKQVKKPQPVDISRPLTLDLVEISPYHLSEIVSPISQDSRLSEFYHQVDWSKIALTEPFSKSLEWREFHKRNPERQVEPAAILKGLDLIQQGTLQNSEPKEYETLQKKLAHILTFLKTAGDEKKSEILTRLGLSAYGYSGAVIWEVDAIYAENITAQDPLKYALQKCRDQIFEKALDKHFVPKNAYPIVKYFPNIERLMNDFLNPADKHNYYLYTNIVAPDFGLTHTHGADTDQMAMSDAIYEEGFKIWNWRVAREIKTGYSKQLIFDTAREKLDRDANVIAHLVNAGVFQLSS